MVIELAKDEDFKTRWSVYATAPQVWVGFDFRHGSVRDAYTWGVVSNNFFRIANKEMEDFPKKKYPEAFL